MKIFLAKWMLFLLLGQAPTAVAPISPAVATGCDNATIACTYTDPNVPAGPHFYFVVAVDSTAYSTPSNRVDVTVPAGSHSAVLKWAPSTTPGVSYYIYRGAPATNVKITGAQ